MDKHGNLDSEWQVGITNDLEKQAAKHKITENSIATAREAKTEESAKAVERCFLTIDTVKGSDKGSSEDGSAKYIYIFKTIKDFI